jgi:hypothetical protein
MMDFLELQAIETAKAYAWAYLVALKKGYLVPMLRQSNGSSTYEFVESPEGAVAKIAALYPQWQEAQDEERELLLRISAFFDELEAHLAENPDPALVRAMSSVFASYRSTKIESPARASALRDLIVNVHMEGKVLKRIVMQHSDGTETHAVIEEGEPA